MKTIAELRKGLACLVRKDGRSGMTCHEYSVCDCTVLSLLSDYERMREALLNLSLPGQELITWETEPNLGSNYDDHVSFGCQIGDSGAAKVARECLSSLSFQDTAGGGES